MNQKNNKTYKQWSYLYSQCDLQTIDREWARAKAMATITSNRKKDPTERSKKKRFSQESHALVRSRGKKKHCVFHRHSLCVWLMCVLCHNRSNEINNIHTMTYICKLQMNFNCTVQSKHVCCERFSACVHNMYGIIFYTGFDFDFNFFFSLSVNLCWWILWIKWIDCNVCCLVRIENYDFWLLFNRFALFIEILHFQWDF